MKYEKPDVQPLAIAARYVQHPMEKCMCGLLDSVNPTLYASLAAYDVDE